MNHRHLILCLLATLTSMDASAWSRMAEAEISSFKGIPCFTISKKEERRNGTPMLSGERKILLINNDSQAWIDEICPVQK